MRCFGWKTRDTTSCTNKQGDNNFVFGHCVTKKSKNLCHQFLFRLSNLKKILSEDVDNAAAALAKTRIKCMDFPEEGDMAEVQLFYKSFTATIVLYRRQIIKYKPKIPQIDPISATLAAVRPGCINDGIVDFTRFTFEVTDQN